jgi:hypothetical protein
MAYSFCKQGIGQERAPALLGRCQFGDHAITVGDQYGFSARGKTDILAELVLEDF